MARVIRVQLKEIAGLIARMGARANPAIQRAATSIALRALTVVQEETAKKGAFNYGTYRSAWFATPMDRGGSTGVLVGNKAPYAGVVEYGRRKGAKQPPREPIARWAQRKFGMPYSEAKQVAFAISRAIKRNGIKGRYVLTSAGTTKKFKQIMEHELLHELMAEWGNV